MLALACIQPLNCPHLPSQPSPAHPSLIDAIRDITAIELIVAKTKK